MEQKYYSVSELRKVLGFSKNKMYSLISEPSFPSIKLGGVYRIPVDGFFEWIEKQADKSENK